MTILMLAIFVVMVGIATRYPAQARFMPFVVGIPGIALCLLQLWLDLRDARRGRLAEPVGSPGTLDEPWRANPEAAPPPADRVRRELALWGYVLGLVAGVLLFGFWVTIPLFILGFLRFWGRASWAFSLGLAISVSLVSYVAFVQGLQVILHEGFVTEYLLDRVVR
jgi:hypothetical protein